MFEMMVKAIFESLEIDGGDEAAEELEKGSQVVVVNCYPPCPEPELTPSNYGFLTLLLQDDVEGLQILYRDEWVTVDPIPGSFVVKRSSRGILIFIGFKHFLLSFLVYKIILITLFNKLITFMKCFFLFEG